MYEGIGGDDRKMKILYGLMSIISIIVRQFFLPNPFACLGESALIANIIAEPFIQAISFGIVGLFYQKRSNPAFGSFLYLVAYSALTGALLLCGLVGFAWWSVVGAVVLTVFVTGGVSWILTGGR